MLKTTAAYLPQHPDFDEDLTVLEQVFSGDTPLLNLLKNYELALYALEQDSANEKISKHCMICSRKWMR